MKKLFLLFLLCCLASGTVLAQDRHLLRLGIGDSLFEGLAFHPANGTSQYAYTGHFFTDYHYSLTKVVSVGAQTDFQGIFWTQDKRRSRNFDLSFMPTVRFTWLHTEWVRLYSGMGAGVLFAFDNAGGFEAAPVVNLNPVGIQLGKTNWCGSLDLGFMTSLRDLHHIYMLGSRLVSVSVNYRW